MLLEREKLRHLGGSRQRGEPLRVRVKIRIVALDVTVKRLDDRRPEQNQRRLPPADGKGGGGRPTDHIQMQMPAEGTRGGVRPLVYVSLCVCACVFIE